MLTETTEGTRRIERTADQLEATGTARKHSGAGERGWPPPHGGVLRLGAEPQVEEAKYAAVVRNVVARIDATDHSACRT